MELNNLMGMEKKRSHEDPVAIQQYCFADDSKAMRVQIVGSDFSEYQTSPYWKQVQSGQISPNPIGQAGFSYPIVNPQVNSPLVVKETEVKVIEVEKIVIQTQIERVEVPVFHTEYKTIEIPVVTTEYKVVEVPTYIKGDTIEILKEIPKYIVQTNTEYKDLPKWLMIFLALNSLATMLLMLKK